MRDFVKLVHDRTRRAFGQKENPPATMPTAPSEEEVLTWFDQLSNWSRWGEGDLLGTLNHITPEKRVAAAGLVRDGLSVSCSWDIRTGPQPGATIASHSATLGASSR